MSLKLPSAQLQMCCRCEKHQLIWAAINYNIAINLLIVFTTCWLINSYICHVLHMPCHNAAMKWQLFVTAHTCNSSPPLGLWRTGAGVARYRKAVTVSQSSKTSTVQRHWTLPAIPPTFPLFPLMCCSFCFMSHMQAILPPGLLVEQYQKSFPLYFYMMCQIILYQFKQSMSRISTKCLSPIIDVYLWMKLSQ